jgi:arylsulfatase A-like enzyme
MSFHRWMLGTIVLAGIAGLLAAVLLVARSPDTATKNVLEQDPLTPSGEAIDRLRAAAEGANIVICVIDAARADHIGCYGYPRAATPNIDRIAESGTLFEQHFCQYPKTDASTASLFTGQHPDTHLAYGNRAVKEDSFTLARALGSAGYHTALFTSNRWISSVLGLGAHFDVVRHGRARADQESQPSDKLTPEALLGPVSSWLDERPPDPFFAYIHFIPPHKPYRAPSAMVALLADSEAPRVWQHGFEFDAVEARMRKQERPPPEQEINQYDANLLWADWAVGEVERLLREADVLDRTILIVTSDHGEAFGEHGYMYHCRGLYDELVHVPLIVRLPGNGPVGRIGALTQSIDLLPTILDLLQIPCPSGDVQGRSLVPLVAGTAEQVNDYVYARAEGDPPSYLIRDQRWSLILYQGGRLRALYDLETDPEQTRNVIGEDPERAAAMLEAFIRFARRQARPPLDFVDPAAQAGEVEAAPKMDLSEEDREELRALGYLD